MSNQQQGRLYYSGMPATAGNAILEIPTWSTLREIEYELQYLYGVLVCDGTVANRYIKIDVLHQTGGTSLGPSIKGVAITAGQTKDFALIKGPVLLNNCTPNTLDLLVATYVIQYPQVIKISIINGVVGDQLTGNYTLRSKAA